MEVPKSLMKKKTAKRTSKLWQYKFGSSPFASKMSAYYHLCIQSSDEHLEVSEILDAEL